MSEMTLKGPPRGSLYLSSFDMSNMALVKNKSCIQVGYNIKYLPI